MGTPPQRGVPTLEPNGTNQSGSVGILVEGNSEGNKFFLGKIHGFERGIVTSGNAKGNTFDVPGGVNTGVDHRDRNFDVNAVIPERIDPALIGRTKLELKAILDTISPQIAELESRFRTDAGRILSGPDSSVRMPLVIAEHSKMESQFNAKFRLKLLALRNESMFRLDERLTLMVRSTTSVLDDGQCAGPTPLVDVTRYIDVLISRLP